MAPDTTFSWHRNRENEFLSFFEQTETLVYCTDVPKLLKTLGFKDYNADGFRIFIDSSKRSLKAVLLSNGNKVALVSIAHSVHLKEAHENLKILLQSIQYDKHQWSICGDIKDIGVLLGQQTGFTKYPSFLCEWDSKARNEHWIKKNWKPRENLEPGSKNVSHDSH